MDMVVLEIREPRGEPRRITVTTTTEVGRDCNGFVLDDPSVSRHHLTLMASPHGLMVTDLGSRNGTLLNDLPLTGTALVRVGGVVRIGATSLMVVDMIAAAGPMSTLMMPPPPSRPAPGPAEPDASTTMPPPPSPPAPSPAEPDVSTTIPIEAAPAARRFDWVRAPGVRPPADTASTQAVGDGGVGPGDALADRIETARRQLRADLADGRHDEELMRVLVEVALDHLDEVSARLGERRVQ